MEQLFSGKGHVYIDKNNYVYILKDHRKGTRYFQCRKKGCYGRLNIKINGGATTTIQHDHEADTQEVKRLKFKHRLQVRAANEHTSLAKIFKQEKEKCPDVVTDKFHSFSRSMYRVRNSVLPPVPKSIKELGEILLDSSWRSKIFCLEEKLQKFFRQTIECEDDTWIAFFVSPTFEEVINIGLPVKLHIDNTYKAGPQLGSSWKYEFFVIHLFIKDIAYPFMNILTSKKSYTVYLTIMQYIQELTPNINLVMVESGNADALQAAATVFPSSLLSIISEDPKLTGNSSVTAFNKQIILAAGTPHPNIWRFIEVLKEMEYNKVCDFMRIQNKPIPKKFVTSEEEEQYDKIQRNDRIVDTEVQVNLVGGNLLEANVVDVGIQVNLNPYIKNVTRKPLIQMEKQKDLNQNKTTSLIKPYKTYKKYEDVRNEIMNKFHENRIPKIQGKRKLEDSAILNDTSKETNVLTYLNISEKVVNNNIINTDKKSPVRIVKIAKKKTVKPALTDPKETAQSEQLDIPILCDHDYIITRTD